MPQDHRVWDCRPGRARMFVHLTSFRVLFGMGERRESSRWVLLVSQIPGIYLVTGYQGRSQPG